MADNDSGDELEVTNEMDSHEAGEHNPRGTMLLMLLFLILIVAMWGYMYMLMIGRG